MEIFIDKNDVYNYVGTNGYEKKIYGSLYGKFNISDTVKLIDTGQYYSSYNNMASAMNIPKERWNFESVKEGVVGVILNRKIHEDKGDILYAVEFNGIHIFGEKGLELVSRYMAIERLEDEDFEL